MEDKMAQLLIKHKVKEYPAWKKVFDMFTDIRKAAGEKSYRILHPENDGNEILAFFEWDNLENARKFAGSSELKQAMGKAGVIGQPEVYFLEEYANGKV
jgi:heme-degrading monooxygenase HmoA